jgi:NAD(P)-dependent dehydrogenase (short-subunit alcohol dehydrogenase family)
MERSICTLITGASSGIGRETSIRLSASRKLILHGRDAARLEETRRLCNNSERHVFWNLDLREVDQIEDSLTKLLEQNQLAVESFVHCAGTLRLLPLRSVDRAMVREIMDVNFSSAVEIVRLLIRKKINEKHLRGIVFVSSTASQFGARGFNLYCASKGALDAFMRALAVELAPGVRVNSVLPGAVHTAMTEGMLTDPETLKRLQTGYPLGLGEPSDIASAIVFLLSDAARWITGQQLVVDGGRTVNITA